MISLPFSSRTTTLSSLRTTRSEGISLPLCQILISPSGPVNHRDVEGLLLVLLLDCHSRRCDLDGLLLLLGLPPEALLGLERRGEQHRAQNRQSSRCNSVAHHGCHSISSCDR